MTGRVNASAKASPRERLEARRYVARQEQAATREGIAERVTLGEGRGEGFAVPRQVPGRAPPVRRLSGLAWLANKGRLSPLQMRAGLAYAEAYQGAQPPPGLRSTLDDTVGGRAGIDFAALQAAMRRRLIHEARLARFRRKLGHQTDLLRALDTICGDEKTPREATANGQDAHALEAVLRVGLDLLAGATPQVQA